MVPLTTVLPIPATRHQLDPHDRILVEESTRLLTVGADAADHGGQVDHGVGAQVSQHSRDLGSPSKVVVPTAEPQGGRTCLLQLLGDVAAEKPGPAADNDGGLLQLHGLPTAQGRQY